MSDPVDTNGCHDSSYFFSLNVMTMKVIAIMNIIAELITIHLRIRG